MNSYERCIRDCKLGAKTYQNILAATKYFERLCELANSDDSLTISSIFQAAVIRYAKPFINIQTSAGKLKYPTKPLQKIDTFDQSIHEHLIKLRNTLIAHDDFEQIDPRVLQFGITYKKIPVLIPTAIVISNKCLSYPAHIESAHQMKTHVQGVLRGVAQKLNNDLGRLRKLTLENPQSAFEDAPYKKQYGQDHIPKEGKRLSPPNFINDEWLNIGEPNFSDIHSGYRYEEIKFRRDFVGPETVKLPGGYEIRLDPNDNNK